MAIFGKKEKEMVIGKALSVITDIVVALGCPLELSSQPYFNLVRLDWRTWNLNDWLVTEFGKEKISEPNQGMSFGRVVYIGDFFDRPVQRTFRKHACLSVAYLPQLASLIEDSDSMAVSLSHLLFSFS